MGLFHSASIVRSGLVLHLDAANPKSYPGTGAAWNDLSGNGNNGTLTGPTYSIDENISMNFDGVDDYITNSILCNKTYYSVNWWMNPVTRTNYNQTIGFNTNNTQTWGAFLFHTTTTGQIYIGTTGLDTDRMTPTNLPANTLITAQWQNFCWTFDNGTAKFYKNGTLLATKILPLSTLSSFTSFTLGTSNSSTINGKISSVQIYSNKVLTSSEVKQNFEALRGRYGI